MRSVREPLTGQWRSRGGAGRFGRVPGPAVHHMIAERLKASVQSKSGLGALSDAEYQALQDLLAQPENLPYLFVGCHGPDPFFFNLKDLDPTLAALVNLYLDVGDFLREFEETLLAAVPQPVLDALEAYDELKNEVIQDSALLSEIQQTFDDLNRILSSFMPLLSEAVKKFVSDFNVYDVISHPYRDGAGEGDWWWFDAMHYRKTGRFTEAMLEATRDLTSPHHLYAVGYLTHVAADTVGHAYVNLNAGGPYRSQAQRHKTLENFQDVFNLLGETNRDWNHSRLHALYNFNYAGIVTDTEPADHPECPDDLATFIADTLNRVYQEDGDPAPDYAKAITADDVKDTYRLWYRFMRGFTQTGTLPPPVSYSLSAELKEVWEKTLDNLGEAGDIIRDAVDEAGDWGILGIFIILGALILAGVKAAGALADGIAGAAATLGTATIRYAACLIYEQIYNAFAMFRLALALNGLGFPLLSQLGDPRFKQFITPDGDDPTGVNAADVFGSEPLLRFLPSGIVATIFHQERHLIYPLTDGEKVATTPAPPSYLTRLATHPAFGRITLDAELLDDLVALAASGNADEADLTAVLGDRTLGNALDLTEALYDRWVTRRPLPDFNLDSDRGYGYLCWTQRGDAPNEPSQLRTNADAADPTEVEMEVIP